MHRSRGHAGKEIGVDNFNSREVKKTGGGGEKKKTVFSEEKRRGGRKKAIKQVSRY